LAADLASKRPAAVSLVLTPISRRPLPLTLALGLGILPLLGVIGLAVGTAADPGAAALAMPQAPASGSTVIGVPGGGERLDLASLQPIRPMGVRFRYAAAGEDFRPGSADCQAGLLADLPPQTPQEAQRLNAVCQVTYGNP